MKPYILVTGWTAEGRVAKYLDFETEAEANDERDRLIDEETILPDSFVHPRIEGAFPHWRVDPKNQTITLDPDRADLEGKLKQAVHAEANRRVDELVPPERAMPTLMEAVLIAHREAKGRATKEESDKGDALENMAVAIKQIRKVEADFIANDLPKLTQEALLNFNPASDVPWPPAPGGEE